MSIVSHLVQALKLHIQSLPEKDAQTARDVLRQGVREILMSEQIASVMASLPPPAIVMPAADEIVVAKDAIVERVPALSPQMLQSVLGLSTPVEVYTDGACSCNPGPGGWSAVFVPTEGQEPQVLSGFKAQTTNNEMEITAILNVVEAASPGQHIQLYTDSALCIGWLSLGWKRKEPVNAALCAQIDAIVSQKSLTMTYVKVKGHSGNRYNEMCDQIAVEARLRGVAS